MKLYSNYISSCSWRVRTVLNYKHIKYEYIAINLNDDQIKFSEEFTKISKTNRVPTLILENGLNIGESMAICEYLEEKYPSPPLYPKNLEQKAQIRNFCEIINSAIQPLQNVRSKAVVFLFVETSCPISNRYAPEIKRLYEKYN